MKRPDRPSTDRAGRAADRSARRSDLPTGSARPPRPTRAPGGSSPLEWAAVTNSPTGTRPTDLSRSGPRPTDLGRSGTRSTGAGASSTTPRSATPRPTAPRPTAPRPTGRRVGTALLDDRTPRPEWDPNPRRGSGRGPEDTRPPSQADREEPRGRRPGPGLYPRSTAVPQHTALFPKAASPKAKSVRGRRQRAMRQAPGRPDNRIKIVLFALLLMLVVAVIKLTFIQGWSSTAYAEKSFDQRTRDITVVADRGTILDRNGTAVAFTIEGKAIAGRPYLFVSDAERQQVVDALVAAFGSRVDAADLMAKLKSDNDYVYLVRGLMPDEADKAIAAIQPILIAHKAELDPIYADNYLDGVATEAQALRQYPDGGLNASVVGKTSSWDGAGTMGIENSFNSVLAGSNGTRTVEVSPSGVIPGSAQDLTPAVNGSDVTLTLDADLQYSVTEKLQSYVDQTGAKRGMAIVQDVTTGEIYSLATYQPGVDAAAQANIAVSAPFEPGSVNKVVTFAAALEAGLITPTTPSTVDGEIQMGGRTIHDAWAHGPITMTATGILAKSSNVGTLQIAQQLGPDAFEAELVKMGLGQKTGIELAGESAGLVPDRENWSSTTFANLPIGQGLSMNLIQMASMYQAIGNHGVKLPSTLIKGTTTDGTFTAAATGAGTSVMSPTTADTLVGMLEGTTQDGDTAHRGTAAGAAITGYRVAAKTGTAQQVDPVTNDYSKTMFNSTIAGLIPADNPKFVVAIMLDAPQGGKNAVPLFHDIAAYAMRAFDVAPSATTAPVQDLYLNSTP